MPRRLRKFIGTLTMLMFGTFYALLAMALSQARPLQEASSIVQAIVYGVIGIAWILPLMPLIAWMEGHRPGDGPR